jgi:cobalamin biosynthetic protein CobC
MAHGGMLSLARRMFPRAPTPFLDLSTGINPVPYPMPILPNDAFTRLPDADDEASLRAVAAIAYGASDPAMVAAAPGTQILISLLPHLMAPHGQKVAILSPTYGEHAASWRAAGCGIVETTQFSDLAEAAIAVVCNPNNPTGLRITPGRLLALADQLAAKGGMLVVDEAFADLEPGPLSVVPHLPHPAILVLRSFGKTYGLAGLRLGFLIGVPELAARARAALGPWAVSGPALAAGLQALPDLGWRVQATQRLGRDGAKLDKLLQARAMELIGGTNLFRLYRGQGAASMFDRLGSAGILVRRFETTPDHLRFGLPATGEDWARLEAALQSAHTSRP